VSACGWPGEDALQHFSGEEIKQLADADRLVHTGTGTGKTRGAA
jgi:hypothetical protein